MGSLRVSVPSTEMLKNNNKKKVFPHRWHRCLLDSWTSAHPVEAAASLHSSHSFLWAGFRQSPPAARSHSCYHCHRDAGGGERLSDPPPWQCKWRWCSWGPGLLVSYWSWIRLQVVCMTAKRGMGTQLEPGFPIQVPPQSKSWSPKMMKFVSIKDWQQIFLCAAAPLLGLMCAMPVLSCIPCIQHHHLCTQSTQCPGGCYSIPTELVNSVGNLAGQDPTEPVSHPTQNIFSKGLCSAEEKLFLCPHPFTSET